MKRFLSLFMATMLCFVSCYDDSDLRDSIKDLDTRVDKLELLCSQMNTNISSMQTLLEAVQNNDYVTGVTPIVLEGKEVGYTITFTKSKPITIYHGKNGTDGKPGIDGKPGTDGKPGQDGQNGDDGHSPVIGVKQDTDGIYYWTLDGEWLLDDNGNKIKAIGTDGADGQDGITPQLRIADGYWEITYDNGNQWDRLGKATGENGQNGNSFFESVKDSETSVTFVLTSGESIVLPKIKSLSISFDDFDIGIVPGGTSRVGYTVHGSTGKTMVKAIAQNGWSAIVQKSSDTRGELVVTAPYDFVEDQIILLVSDGEGPTYMSSINFVTGEFTPSTEAIEVPIEGGQFEVSVNTNLEYSVLIPSTDQSWISFVPQTKSTRTDHLNLIVKEYNDNPNIFRISKIHFQTNSGEILKSLNVIQNGKMVCDLMVTANDVDIPLNLVKGGTFTMGATPEQDGYAYDDEKPAHQVTLSDYYIGQTEVTQELWEAVMGSNPSYFGGNPKNPVEEVSWYEIVNDFLPKLNELTGKIFTLPTEAQWEYAARGGNKTHGCYRYSGSDFLDVVAWTEQNSNDKTHPVGQMSPNELGLYDMSGNVNEWCADGFESYTPEAQTNPTVAPESCYSAVFRGGCIGSDHIHCRVSNRDRIEPQARHKDLGFRLVLMDDIFFNTKYLNLLEGQSETIQATINGSFPIDSRLTWTSSDKSVATVDANGKVTAVRSGSATITARMDTTGKELSCNVHVLIPIVYNGVLLFNMVRVDGGTFTMGATSEQGNDAYGNEKPAHQVTLSDYYIGQTEVTQELWEAVMGSNPSYFGGNPKNPVEEVSWYEIVNDFLPTLNYATGLNFTLPTEAQWEFAARGGNKSKGYKYSGSNDINEVAWSIHTMDVKPVAQKYPNELGIYDMTGNVWEWCSDWYGDYSSDAQTDPTGPASGSYRVLRGGACNYYTEDSRVSVRNSSNSDSGYRYYGFRLVISK